MIRIFIYSFLLLILASETALAQFYYFGRNKVQFEKFDWKILKTDHFDIYYYGEMLEIAEIGATYAEEIYEELKVTMNHVVTRRVPLIFYNTHIHFQQTNITPGFIPEGVGGFFEFIKGRVVLPSNGSLKDFRHVIRHELVHVFMVNKIYRVLVDHRLPSDLLPPLWFVEGLAEYLSTEVDAQAEMVMRDAVLNNYFVGIEDINRIYGTFLMYKEGQSFLEFVEEKYGKEKIPLMLENFWMFTNFNRVIEYTIDKTIKEIDSDWHFYLKKKYYPLIQDNAPIEHASQKITDFGFNFSPAFYEKDNQHFIYFVGNRDGYSSLYRLEIDEKEKVIDGPDIILRGEKTEELESFHLFQSSIDISKDGLLVFVTKKGATDAIHIYSISRNEIIRTFQYDHLINLTSPKFSSDTDNIVFHAVDQKGFSDIFIINMNDNSLTRLTNDYYDDRDPVFGLNDSHILFSSDRTSGENEMKHNIFSYDLKNNRIEYVTYLNANNYNPVISSDKKSLFFTSDLDGVRNIWAIDFEKPDSIRKITNFITSAFYPSFINNDKIVFSGFENFSFNLYTLDLNSIVADTTIQVALNFPDFAEKWKPGMLIGRTERKEFKYTSEYTLDYAQSQVTTDPIFGTRGGAVLSLSDLLGNDNYFFLIYNTADVQSDFLKSFNIALQRVNLSERTNYGYGVFHFSGRRYDIRDSDEYCS
jgi:Tol biopolymer transport system component